MQVAEGIPTTQGGTPIPVEDYAYDEEGNRTASHLSALYSSNDHNKLEEDDSYTYAYDLKGNRTSQTSKVTGDVETYTYDSENRLVGYSSPATSAAYAFDAIERRIAKTVDGVTTAFIHDYDKPDTMEPSHIVMEFDGTQTLSSRWVFGPSVDEPIGFEAYAGATQPGFGTEKALYADRQGSVQSVISSATASTGLGRGPDTFVRKV